MERLLSKNKREVYVLDKALERMDEEMFQNVKEALSKTYITDSHAKKCVDMGRIVGKNNCVKVGADDQVKWLWMKGKGDRIPFVYGRDGEDTNFVTIIINEHNGRSVLVAAYYGEPAPMTHKDAAHRGENESYIKKCYAFWHTHALVYDEALVDLRRSKKLLG